MGAKAIPFSVPASNFLATPLTLTNTPTVGEPDGNEGNHPGLPVEICVFSSVD